MDKIEELENKLKEMQDELAELKQKEKEKEENKRWRAEENGEIYYAIGNHLNVEDYDENGGIFNNERYQYHNYFQTPEEAQAVADNIKTHIELIELAEELNEENEEPVNWEDFEQHKYFLMYDYECDKVNDDWQSCYQNANTVYCTNSNFKDEAIKRIGEERLVKYLKGE